MYSVARITDCPHMTLAVDQVLVSSLHPLLDNPINVLRYIYVYIWVFIYSYLVTSLFNTCSSTFLMGCFQSSVPVKQL